MSCALVFSPSLSLMCSRCASTVLALRQSFSAMSLIVSPCADEAEDFKFAIGQPIHRQLARRFRPPTIRLSSVARIRSLT